MLASFQSHIIQMPYFMVVFKWKTNYFGPNHFWRKSKTSHFYHTYLATFILHPVLDHLDFLWYNRLENPPSFSTIYKIWGKHAYYYTIIQDLDLYSLAKAELTNPATKLCLINKINKKTKFKRLTNWEKIFATYIVISWFHYINGSYKFIREKKINEKEPKSNMNSQFTEKTNDFSYR